MPEIPGVRLATGAAGIKYPGRTDVLLAPFDKGTTEIAKYVAARTKAGKLVSVAGGGDTVAALANAEVKNQFTYVSTAGGAFLEWMEGKALPGVEALRA